MLLSKNTLAAMLVLSVVAMGCSSSSSTSPEDDDGMTGGGSVADYDGNWTNPCHREGDGVEQDERWGVTNFNFNGNTVVSTKYAYIDADCSVPDQPAATQITVRLDYTGGTTNTSLGVARHIDTTIQAILFDGSPPTSEEEEQLQIGRTYATDYDLILLADDRLYLGLFTNEYDGQTADARPVEMDLDNALIRQ